MSNRRDNQFTYTPHNKATLVDCSFTVNHTDTGGLGITGLKPSGRVGSVFMNTNQTAGVVNGVTNPNPQAGIIIVTLQDNYNTFYMANSSLTVPGSGSNISSGLTLSDVYTITVLGNTTLAQWQAAGVPSYITPAVGVSFVAAATSFTGTGRVQAPAATGDSVFSLAVIGNPNAMNSSGANVSGAGVGMQIILGCYADTAADTPLLTAPADGTQIALSFYLNNTSSGV